MSRGTREDRARATMTDEKRNKLFSLGLCQMAIDLRQQCNGAGDPMDIDDVADWRAYLQERLDTWREPTSAFDLGVKIMVTEALAFEAFSRQRDYDDVSKLIHVAHPNWFPLCGYDGREGSCFDLVSLPEDLSVAIESGWCPRCIAEVEER